MAKHNFKDPSGVLISQPVTTSIYSDFIKEKLLGEYVFKECTDAKQKDRINHEAKRLPKLREFIDKEARKDAVQPDETLMITATTLTRNRPTLGDLICFDKKTSYTERLSKVHSFVLKNAPVVIGMLYGLKLAGVEMEAFIQAFPTLEV